MPELLDGLVDIQLIVPDLLQQFFYLFSLNMSPLLVYCTILRVCKNGILHTLRAMNCLLLARASNLRKAQP
jgi:hypothetical protein